MEIIGKVTNKHGHQVSVIQNGDGYKVWNHEHAVEMPASELDTAWQLVDTDPTVLGDD